MRGEGAVVALFDAIEERIPGEGRGYPRSRARPTATAPDRPRRIIDLLVQFGAREAVEDYAKPGEQPTTVIVGRPLAQGRRQA